MNKQELAAQIWKSANNMRSKIDANEYKDYILGFIFYKFLSDKELNGLLSDGWTKDDLKTYLVEENEDLYKTCRNRYGYFIAYKDLFSNWLELGNDFDASNVTDALSAFERNINENHRKVFDKIFNTLNTGLSKLGESSSARTKAVGSLLSLINPIPMDDKQGYDVLGFIYEYLISNFAANAGKKAGEFYTPHEVSLVMSQIVANHLKDRDTIQIYDPTSGSGSLLINIGQSVAKYLKDKDKIKYYAQELKENTYSLTRMNLVMRGIKPENIIARCGDTLEEDWPYFEEGNRENTYEALYVDAVVSNPPYSQKWTPHDDVRFSNYGIAPASKADYAFLLHDLYHLNADGIMTIVLPHGVLFRGGEEGNIRRNLIENDNIDTIIGLPANIFFGTGIPTIIMVLKKRRTNSDVLIIDASKGFIKEGKNNKLRSCDIKKIVDTVVNRVTINKFSCVVSKDEIRNNDYNLNIPRYVDSNVEAETFDISAIMSGSIPNKEIDEFNEYWNAFPTLKKTLFNEVSENYSTLNNIDVKNTILTNRDVTSFVNNYKNSFLDFDGYLENLLFNQEINVNKKEEFISNDIFKRFLNIKLIDKYQAYQIFAECWSEISNDLEILQTEGESSINKIDPVYVIKKKGNDTIEVQDGWKGHVVPFALVQKAFFNSEQNDINKCNEQLNEISSLYSEKLGNLSEDERSEINSDISDEGDSFINKEVLAHSKKLHKQNGKLSSAEIVVCEVAKLIEEEKVLKAKVKKLDADLIEKTMSKIKSLAKDEAKLLLHRKWIEPLISKISDLPLTLINSLNKKIVSLSKKYETKLIDIESEIKNTQESLITMIDELDGSEDDLNGLKEFKKLLGGE